MIEAKVEFVVPQIYLVSTAVKLYCRLQNEIKHKSIAILNPLHSFSSKPETMLIKYQSSFINSDDFLTDYMNNSIKIFFFWQ